MRIVLIVTGEAYALAPDQNGRQCQLVLARTLSREREISIDRAERREREESAVRVVDLRVLQLVELVYRAIPGMSGGGCSAAGRAEAIWVEPEPQSQHV